MLRRLVLAAILNAGALMAPATVSAATYGCPDDFIPVPVQAVPPDQQKKDRNNNLFVCVKFADDHVVVGPDDKVEDDFQL